MPSPEMHGRIRNSYNGKPRFNVVERYVYGTPTGAKAATVVAVAHPLAEAAAQSDH